MESTSLSQKKASLVQLGTIFNAVVNREEWSGYSLGINKQEFDEFVALLPAVKSHNGWFSLDMIFLALGAWSELLTSKNLDTWLGKYTLKDHDGSKSVAIICAGNIPLVGFHDVLCCYLSGHSMKIKLSSDDALLIKSVVELLSKFDGNVYSQLSFVENKLKDFDAVIATGSNNTSRYFNDYFGKYPNIIRKSRTSIAVLSGSESEDEMERLADDVFSFYGLGCRNVTKLFLPRGFDLDRVFKGFFKMKDVIQNNKYANNYDYHKSIFLLENFKILENGFLILKEDDSLFSPIGTLYYEYYDDLNNVEKTVLEHKSQIQCRVGFNGIPFGDAQNPQLWDYADQVDTIGFLNEL